jgi:4-amino-4-deoxy-L-arabinose transferase-like glycosyltransferase
MAYEVISFKTFMAGSSPVVASIYPSAHVMHMLDGGLVFFCGLGVAVLGLVLLEKCGVSINEKNVRWLMWGGILVALGVAILNNPLSFLW